MYFVTLGHFLASSAASAEVIRRQLLSPKPSASASVIFLLPHHDGAPATGLPPPLLPEALPLSSLPQAAATTATLARTAIVALGFQMALLMDLLLRWTDRPGVIPGWRPRNGPTPQGARLDEVLRRVADAGGQQQLVELSQEQRGHSARRHAAPPAEQRGAPEDHRGDGRQQIAVALE